MNSISKLAMPLKRTAAGKRLSPMILLTGIVATMLSTASMAQPQQQLIHVQGTGAMSVTPNAYSVTFVIEEQGETVGKLNTTLASDLRAVVSFLLEQGIERNNIQSMQVRLTPRYVNSPNGRVQEGFTLSREISVTDSNIENLSLIHI